MKMLVGRKFTNPEVQAELEKAPFVGVAMPNGSVGINVMYDDEQITVSAEHFMAMCLVKAMQISSSANSNIGIGDCALAVPAAYTDAQRRGVINACEIASLHCLKVGNENNAVALSYGIFKSAKKMFSETDKENIMFIDMGYSQYCVTIASFLQGSMKILATVCLGIGGRNYDEAIIEYLCGEFEKKSKINVRKNKKALIKLQVAAEKAKKTLSPNGVSEAPVNVECLAEDTDLNCTLKKVDFDAMTQFLNDQLSAPILQCLSEAGLEATDLKDCEIVGGGSRVQMVKRTVGAVLGLNAEADAYGNFGLKTTMNSDEAVARGAALQCAMLSSRIRVQPFNITDKLYYGIIATYDSTSTGVTEEGKDDEQKSSSAQLYNRGDDVPHKPRRLTFRKKNADFKVSLSYDNNSNLPEDEKLIANYLIKVPVVSSPQDVRVTFNIDKHGCVYLQCAEMLEEIPAEEVKPVEESVAADATTPMDTTDATATATADSKEGEAKSDGDDSKTAAAADTEAKPATPAADATPAKKRFRKTDLETVIELPGLTRTDIKNALELEASMAGADKLIVETADKRNELEAYIYSMRHKLDDANALKNYTAPEEKTALLDLLTKAEEWLYEDGFDSTKTKYTAKLDEMFKISNPIERRITEEMNRPGAIESLKKQIEMCKTFAQNYEERYKHIEETDRDKIRTEAASTEEWMYDQIGKQGELNKNKDPALTVEDITKKRNALFQVTNPIMIKKAPAPVVVPVPTPVPTEAETNIPDDEQANVETPAENGEEGAKGEGAAESDASVPAAEGTGATMDESI